MAETWSLLRRAHGWLLGVGLFTYAGTLIRGPVTPLRRADLSDCVDVRQDVACSTIFDLRTRNRPCATRNNVGTTVVANHSMLDRTACISGREEGRGAGATVYATEAAPAGGRVEATAGFQECAAAAAVSAP